MRIGFAGTPEFARVALAALVGSPHQVPLVMTQPDRPAGRGMKLQASAVKQLAVEHGIDVAQPRSLRLDGKFPDDAAAAQAALQAADLDVLVVAAYGLILPQWVLNTPRHGCLNIHGSLLPRWRGAAPIHRAIEAGDARTGITIMQMDAGLDTGDMLLEAAVDISPEDSTATLHDRLAALGAQCLMQTLDQLAAGVLQPTRQPADGVNYAHKIEKAEGAIDWTQPAATIERRIRAFYPFPGCTAELGGQTLKVWRARVVLEAGLAEPAATPGQVLKAADGQLVVACGTAALELLELQLPGGKRIAAREFLQRHPLP
jgi:methionyl-tRNA formyltransferase